MYGTMGHRDVQYRVIERCNIGDNVFSLTQPVKGSVSI